MGAGTICEQAGQQRRHAEGGMQAPTIADTDPHDVPIGGDDRGRACRYSG